MNETERFHPTIPIAVRRLTGGHLADGLAEAQPTVGPTGFSTRYLTALGLVDSHVPRELLADEVYELVLSTGHALAGHFYPSPHGSPEHPVFLFIPSGMEADHRSME